MRFAVLVAAVFSMAPVAMAALPEPPKGESMIPWQIPWGGDLAVMSASDLLEKPAGKAGVIGVRGEHFVTADGKRIRFWGVNVAFTGGFPTHAQADVLAVRLAALGVNCVRFHHMDMFAWPRGIFADAKLETLHPEALDRLDYYIAALKKQGVYANINLHVSRSWSRSHKMPNADKLDMDKVADIFYPELIGAQKQYARDLMGHVNKYTNVKYADEPAIAMVEINNENTLFLWGGDRRIADLPEPYGPYLSKLWNEWLAKKYGTREKLKEAWGKGAEPLGENMLRLPGGMPPKPAWNLGLHEGAGAKMEYIPADKSPRGEHTMEVKVTKRTDTPWHVQMSQAGLEIRKGQRYTLSFDITVATDAKVPQIAVDAGVGQAHEPWSNLGLNQQLKLKPGERRHVAASFVGTGDDKNARVSFILGSAEGVTHSISNMSLAPGGIQGLRDGEEFGKIERRTPEVLATQQRSDDWFDFLQQLDETYFVSMREFLKTDVGVKQPITGTIGLGALGTMSQAKMDFVDAHSYWDHPQFPRKGWDSKDWKIKNKPMSDDPAAATLWSLAATRVAGKPFTVTEYNHAAPNEWQAECMPMIAAFAAAQDWDGVFLFAYAHNDKFETRSMDGFFDLEGNGPKLAQMPLAARVFLGGMGGKETAMQMGPLAAQTVVKVGREQAVQGAPRHYFQLWNQLGEIVAPTWEESGRAKWERMLSSRVAISFDEKNAPLPMALEATGTSLTWPDEGVGMGRFICTGRGAEVFAGFVPSRGVDVGSVRIERATSPFVTLIAVSKAPGRSPFEGETLVCVVGRSGNTGMKWNAERNSVSDQWGKGPAVVEKIATTLSIRNATKPRIVPIGSDGKAMAEIQTARKGDRWEFTLPGETVWYQVGN